MKSGAVVINLCSTVLNEKIKEMCPGISRVIKAVPQPPVAHHRGITIVYPADPQVKEFFETMGSVVEADSLAKCQAL